MGSKPTLTVRGWPRPSFVLSDSARDHVHASLDQVGEGLVGVHAASSTTRRRPVEAVAGPREGSARRGGRCGARPPGSARPGSPRCRRRARTRPPAGRWAPCRGPRPRGERWPRSPSRRGRRLALGLEPGKGREQRRVHVHHPARKRAQEPGGEPAHEPREADEIDSVFVEEGGDLGVEGLPGLTAVVAEEGGHAGAAGVARGPARPPRSRSPRPRSRHRARPPRPLEEGLEIAEPRPDSTSTPMRVSSDSLAMRPRLTRRPRLRPRPPSR